MEQNNENQAQLLVFGVLQEHMVHDPEVGWYLDIDNDSDVLDNLTMYTCTDPGNAMSVLCTALQCAATFLGALCGDGEDPRDLIMSHSVNLLVPKEESDAPRD